MAISVISPPPAGLQPEITANGILQGNGTGVVTAAAETEVELVEINKTTVGLSNVDNTSDADKPVSTATQIALDKKRVVNENLVDNWYFGNPVNQRGQASYSGVYQMALDRWAINDIVISSTGEISNLGSNPKIYQRVVANQYAIPVGTPVTLSAVYAGELLTVSGVVAAGGSIVLIKEGNTAYISAWVLEGMQGVQITPKAAGQLLAVKLELGSAQTLAHRDDSGKWVLNEVPNYALELAKCQRYFYRKYLTGAYVGLGFGTAFTASRLRMYFPLPTTMRAIPAVSAYSAVGTNDMEAILSNPNSPIKFSLTDITTMAWDKTNICIEFAISGGTQGSQYQIRGNGASGVRYIDFSAEL